MKHIIVRSATPLLMAGAALWGFIALLSVSACAEEQGSLAQTVTVVAMWVGREQDSFLAVLDEFTNRTGISITYEQSTNISDRLLNCTASGTCPEVAVLPNPGLMSELVGQGALVPLAPIVTEFDIYYTTTWRSLSSVGGALYGVPLSAAHKSIIWYRPRAFDAISATVPFTWTTMLSLCDDLVANGQTPFAIGADVGWPLTDWFENILLRVGGPEAHRKLMRHDIPWTHPTVVETMQRFSDIVRRDEHQVGGITGTLTTNLVDAIDLVFGASPSATMYFGASFIQASISPSLTPVTDYNTFIFPEIDPTFGKPLMGGGSLVVLFHDTAQARSLVQFLASPDAAEIWAARGGGFLSPNSGVNLSTYADELSRAHARQLAEASNFVFDLDDQLPFELQTYVWGALRNFVAHQDQMMSILQGIEDKATELQGPPYIPLY